MALGSGPGHVWRPVSVGRHAFSASARDVPHEEQVKARCGVTVLAAELHGANELAWIREDTCMDCWRTLAIT